MGAKKYLLFFLFFILFSSMTLADTIYETPPSNTSCISDTLAQYRWDYTNETGDWNTVYMNYTCVNNCSSSLNSCRFDDPSQLMISFGMIFLAVFGCIVAYYVGGIIHTLDLPLYTVLTMLLLFFGGALDVLYGYYRTLLLASSFLPLGFLMASIYNNLKGRRNDSRATGRI